MRVVANRSGAAVRAAQGASKRSRQVQAVVVASLLLAVLAFVRPYLAHAVTLLEAPNGQAVVIYQPLGQGGREVVARAGASLHALGRPRVLTTSAWRRSDAIAAMSPSGTVFAAWSTDYVGALRGALRPPGGPFELPVTLAGRMDSSFFSPAVAINGRGNVAAFWGSNSAVFRALRQADSGFGSPLRLAVKSVHAPTLDDADEALFTQTYGDRDRTVHRQAVLLAADGQIEQVLETPSEPYAALTPSGDGLVAWVDQGEIKLAERQPQAAFGAVMPLVTGGPAATAIDALKMTSHGAVALVWAGTDGQTYLSVRLAGGNFSAPTLVPGVGVAHPTLALNDAGAAAVAWRSGARVLASYRSADGPSGRAIALDTPGPLQASGPRDDVSLAIDAAGEATAVWERSDGERVHELGRSFTAAGPGSPFVIATPPAFRRVAPASACSPRGTRTVLETRELRVFRHRAQGGTEIEACLFAKGEWEFIGDDLQLLRPPALAAASPLLAYVQQDCDAESCVTSLIVNDLRNPNGDGIYRQAPSGRRANDTVGSVVLRPNGAVGWISCAMAQSAEGTLCRKAGRSAVVWRWNASADRPQRIASGLRIEPGSLRLDGQMMTWLDQGKRQRARLY